MDILRTLSIFAPSKPHRAADVNDFNDAARLPCSNLPARSESSFSGRVHLLSQMDSLLKPSPSTSSSTTLSTFSPAQPPGHVQTQMRPQSIKSLMLHGLGGIGKTSLAHAYALQKFKRKELDAVLWVDAANEVVLQRSLGRIATHGLRLESAARSDEESSSERVNVRLVLAWLMQTHASWLLVFDNVEDGVLLESVWPADTCGQGSVVVTTRRRDVAGRLVGADLEVSGLMDDEGAHLVQQILGQEHRHLDESERRAAVQLSMELSGLPLAITQMVALIRARQCSIEQFLEQYRQQPAMLHREGKEQWDHDGYGHTLSTVWNVSFAALHQDAAACLGVISFLAPDFIPAEVFDVDEEEKTEGLVTRGHSKKLPARLEFCQSTIVRDKAILELTSHSLMKQSSDRSTFSLHRLVQAEYRYQMTDSQDDFDNAVLLVSLRFPHRPVLQQIDTDWPIAARYLSHVLELVTKYNDSQKDDEVLKPTTEFCDLIADTVHYVHDNDTHHLLPLLLSTGLTCITSLTSSITNDIIHAFLLQMRGYQHLCSVSYDVATSSNHSARVLLEKHVLTDDLHLVSVYSQLGMCYGCQGQYEEARSWFEKGESVIGWEDGRYLQPYLNSARNWYCLGEWEMAKQRLDRSLLLAMEGGGWYCETYVHLAYASYHCRRQEYIDARIHVQQARNIIERSGTIARFSWLSGNTAYRAGCVAMAEGRIEEAVTQTHTSISLFQLLQAPTGILARATHAFAKALSSAGRKDEAEQARKEAQDLRARLPAGSTDLSDESDAAYERCVKMDQR